MDTNNIYSYSAFPCTVHCALKILVSAEVGRPVMVYLSKFLQRYRCWRILGLEEWHEFHVDVSFGSCTWDNIWQAWRIEVSGDCVKCHICSKAIISFLYALISSFWNIALQKYKGLFFKLTLIAVKNSLKLTDPLWSVSKRDRHSWASSFVIYTPKSSRPHLKSSASSLPSPL